MKEEKYSSAKPGCSHRKNRPCKIDPVKIQCNFHLVFPEVEILEPKLEIVYEHVNFSRNQLNRLLRSRIASM